MYLHFKKRFINSCSRTLLVVIILPKSLLCRYSPSNNVAIYRFIILNVIYMTRHFMITNIWETLLWETSCRWVVRPSCPTPPSNTCPDFRNSNLTHLKVYLYNALLVIMQYACTCSGVWWYIHGSDCCHWQIQRKMHSLYILSF